MPTTLTTTISKIQLVPNSTNASVITEFHNYLIANEMNLQVIMGLPGIIGTDIKTITITFFIPLVLYHSLNISAQLKDIEK